ncbi:CRISPR-associated protein Cas2 [Paenibacillus chitinolyticus]
MAKIVTYDLCAPGKKYDNLITAIKAYPGCAKLTESCWIIATQDSCKTIRENLYQHLDSNDRIFVAKLTGEAAWKNTLSSIEDVKKVINM